MLNQCFWEVVKFYCLLGDPKPNCSDNDSINEPENLDASLQLPKILELCNKC